MNARISDALVFIEATGELSYRQLGFPHVALHDDMDGKFDPGDM